MINKDYVYKEPTEWTERRNNIRKSQVPIERLQELVESGASEREIQKVLKQDMSFLSDYFQSPQDEYICLSEVYPGGIFIILSRHVKQFVC